MCAGFAEIESLDDLRVLRVKNYRLESAQTFSRYALVLLLPRVLLNEQ